MRTIFALLTATSLLGVAAAAAAQSTFTVTVEQPQNGRLTFTPPLPADGVVPAGSRIAVRARPDSGHVLDAIFEAVPGVFGPMYTESRERDYTVVVDRDKRVGALFLPSDELPDLREIQNVVYAKPGVKPLKYDVFAPKRADRLPIVAIIHGGGWVANGEDIMRGMAREIASSGRYVAVSIDYRWAGVADGDARANSMADLIGDVFGALAHVQEHAQEYGADPRYIVVTGDSAGGHLAAVAATMADKIGSGGFGTTPGVFEFRPSYMPRGADADDIRRSLTTTIKAAAPSYGVFSDRLYGRVALQHYADAPNADASWVEAIAPIRHIPHRRQRAVPHYLIRGTADPLIPFDVVRDYALALEAQGQSVKHVEVDGASHAFFDWKPDQATRDTFAKYGVPYIKDMLTFFDAAILAARPPPDRERDRERD
jgi:acetyl esterase